MSETKSVKVTMVKKKLASGEPCKKCAQAEDMLRRRQLWEGIDEVVWADETDPSSTGMVLAKEHQIETAPFFVVRDGEQTKVYPSAIKLAKEVLAKRKPGASVRPTRPGSSLGSEETLALASALSGQSAERVMRGVLEKLGKKCGIAFSGAEDVALIDMAAKTGLEFSVFCLDTGRLYPETYRFIDRVRQHYGIDIHVVSPDFVAVEELVRRKGLFSFYEDGHGECCDVRKVRPLKRVLAHYDGWITGQRRDQSPTRADVPLVSWDETHKSPGMLKANPLAEMSQRDVWEYLQANDVPYNELHDRGYVSIGCEPCTRAIRPGEHERAARWWWEDSTKRECGLHID